MCFLPVNAIIPEKSCFQFLIPTGAGHALKPWKGSLSSVLKVFKYIFVIRRCIQRSQKKSQKKPIGVSKIWTLVACTTIDVPLSTEL